MRIFDVDGTLFDYAYGSVPVVNWALIRQLQALGVRHICLYSNQGGLLFGVKGIKRADGRPYPTPEVFVGRLAVLVDALHDVGIRVLDVRVSCYHRAAGDNDEMAAALQRAAALVGARP